MLVPEDYNPWGEVLVAEMPYGGPDLAATYRPKFGFDGTLMTYGMPSLLGQTRRDVAARELWAASIITDVLQACRYLHERVSCADVGRFCRHKSMPWYCCPSCGMYEPVLLLLQDCCCQFRHPRIQCIRSVCAITD